MNEKHETMITELRHDLHRHPELSGEEVKTRQILKEFLAAHLPKEGDWELEDRGDWFFLRIPGRNPEAAPVAFRADFDALPMEEQLNLPYASENPGVCHKCGHDGHSAVLCGLALELVNREPMPQDIYLIFQHAEEIGEGGEACARLIEERKIGQIYAFHNMGGIPEGMILTGPGVVQCASEGMTVHFRGQMSHAGDTVAGSRGPQLMARLLDMFSIPADCWRARGILNRTDPDFSGRVWSTVVHARYGGERPDFGIAPGEGEVSVTLRSEAEADLKILEDVTMRVTRSCGSEAEVGFSFRDAFPETRNDSLCALRVQLAAEHLGYSFRNMEEPFLPSEDFGHYLKKCPGAMFYIGAGVDHPQIHTAEYDFNDAILRIGVDMFLQLAGAEDCR